MQTSRNSFWFMLFSLLLLRLVIGMHFFNEGVTKLQSGTFSCAPFLNQAKGPLAPQFQKLLDDYDGRKRLCLSPENTIDTSETFAIWEDFTSSAAAEFQFNEEQQKRADRSLDWAKTWLGDFLASNEAEITAWIDGEQRLVGFARDGQDRSGAALEVASLNDQIGTIKYDRNKAAAPWLAEVESTWDELEARINEIAGTGDGSKVFAVSRPYAQEWSKQAVIDRYLPWFDTVVGCLLILGLFTRFAALAGMGLLLGVVATQPFWALGAQNTYYQWIEVTALLVLLASSAGRFGGLDYFLCRHEVTESNED